jgi:riboflavin transporter FmnP
MLWAGNNLLKTFLEKLNYCFKHWVMQKIEVSTVKYVFYVTVVETTKLDFSLTKFIQASLMFGINAGACVNWAPCRPTLRVGA